MTSIHNACRNGDIETVRSMIAADPELVDQDDEHKWRPIFLAGLRRHAEVVRLLIDSGADLAAHDGYVLHYAGQVPDNQEIMDLLVRHGALDAHVRPVDDLSRQLLMAIFVADETRVRALLALHPELATTVDGRGDQPINHAARNGATEIVRLLIEHGASLDMPTGRARTVLYCAAGHGHLETVQVLLENGADMHAKFRKGDMTLLEWLAQFPVDRRFAPIVRLLLQHQDK